MSRIRGDGLGPEARLWAALRSAGLWPWRNVRSLPGSPDFAFPAERVAVFVHGCFWHACRAHWRLPRTNAGFWAEKAASNARRDARAARALRRAGWSVLVVWEHSVRTPAAAVTAAGRIARRLRRSRPSRP